MEITEVCIIGGGPCGIAAALALKEAGIQSMIIEKGNVVDTIYRYPTHQTFFSSSEKLEVGHFPFVHEERKPRRIHALTYYREVVKRSEINIYTYEKVLTVKRLTDGLFQVNTVKNDGLAHQYKVKAVIVATGYYDNPNWMGVKGEDQPHVFHYFKEGHPFFGLHIAVIGGKNSAIDTALELQKAGAYPHVFYRGEDYSPSIKPWVLPEFTGKVQSGDIQMSFRSEVTEIMKHGLKYRQDGKENFFSCDYVFAMTGYHPDHAFLRNMEVGIEPESGRPVFQEETMETNVPNLFIAGVIAAGNNANEIFIENGRFHGQRIAAALLDRKKAGTF